MEAADDPSEARDAAVSPSDGAAKSAQEAESAPPPSLEPDQQQSVVSCEREGSSQVHLPDEYQEDHSDNTGEPSASAIIIPMAQHSEGEGQEMLSTEALPAAVSGEVSESPPHPEQEAQIAGSSDCNDGSVAVPIKVSSSDAPPPAHHSRFAIDDEEYTGMPKIDPDIEAGKKIVRRRKLSRACPPSSFYSDVQPPGMELVQRALRNHKTTIRPFKRHSPLHEDTEFHDKEGHMLLYGCLNGKYVGDVLGGLPHGHGQHWTPLHGSSLGQGYRHLLYEGAWEYGAKCGYGRMLYQNGQEYRGFFKESQRHGRGAMRYLDGTVYDGEWFKGRRHGLGTSYYKEGGFYKGAWCKDNRDGWGAYYWPSKCRKYEGEWIGDDPVCGNHTHMQESEYMTLRELIPDWCNVKEYFPSYLPTTSLEVPLMELRYPECVYYPNSCERRQDRIDTKRAALKNPPDPKIVVEHKGSLSPEQMQGLRLAFDKLSPGYMRRSTVNRIQMRRLLLLARINPDSDMGRRLFVSLQEAAIPMGALTYNNFMKTILRFHYPREAMPYKQKESPARE